MALVNDVLRVAVRMIGPSNQDIMNVWHVQLTNLVSGVDDDVVADIVSEISAVYAGLEPAVTNLQTGQDISVQNITQGLVFGAEAFNPSFDGTLTGDTAPPTTSIYSYFRTGIPRRVGRKFWGIVTEGHQNNGVITGTITNLLTLLGANFIGGFTGTTTGNTYLYGTYNENKSPQFAPFTQGVTAAVLRVQRRRQIGHGS